MSQSSKAWVAWVALLHGCAAPTNDEPNASESSTTAMGGLSTSGETSATSASGTGGSTTGGSTTGGSITGGSITGGGAVSGTATVSSDAAATATGGGATVTTGGLATTETTGATSTTSGESVVTPLPFTEDFEDGVADGFIDGIDKEQEPLGNWVVVDDGGQVYEQQTPTSDPSWAVGGDYRWTDQLLTVRMKVVSGIDDFVGIVAVRFASFDAYAFLEIKVNQIKLRLRNAGSTNDLAVYKFESDMTEGSWHTYGLGVQGSDYTLYFDEQPIGTASNSELTAGGIALGVSDAVVQFDDLGVSLP